MKNIKLYVVFLMLIAGVVSAQAENDILGQWYTPDKKSIIEFKHDSTGTIQGTLIWVNKEINQEKAGKHLGKIIAKNLTYKKDDERYEGKVYIPQKDTEKDAEFTVDGNTLYVKVKAGFLLSKTVEWTRKET